MKMDDDISGREAVFNEVFARQHMKNLEARLERVEETVELLIWLVGRAKVSHADDLGGPLFADLEAQYAKIKDKFMEGRG